jgi:hypothetical protein
MLITIDVDSHQVIQSAGARSPAGAFTLKNQDTPACNVQFTSQGNVQDYGSSPVLKFGLVTAAVPTVFLAYSDTFTRQLDTNGLAIYQAFPVFNTTQMGTALGSATSIQVIGEIRYQLSDGEIVHVLDIPFTIYRTILVEGGTPATTVIAVYPDPSVLEIKTNKGLASGYVPLNSSAKIDSSFLPSGILAGTELVANKDTASGYVGLDSQELLDADQIPVDGTTLTVITTTITRAGTLTSGSPIVTGLAATSDLTLGQPVSGTGVPGGATVLSIDASNQIHLSANASASGSPLLTFTNQKLSAPLAAALDYADPANGIELRDDFLTGTYAELPFQFYSITSSSAAYNTNTALQARGVALYTADATVPTYVLWSLGNVDSGFEYCMPVAAGPLQIQSKLAVDTLSDGTNTYTCYFGLIRMQKTSFGTSPSPWAGLYFEYDQSNSPNWFACVATGTNKATGVTRVDTGVVVAAHTWINAKIVVNASWNNFQFFINGVLKATITAGNLPTTADSGLSPVYFMNRTASGGAGNIRTFYARGFYMLYQFSDA